MTNWIEKYQTGKIIPSSREIPEITVYGKKNYLQELDKQQQKYLADMAKYKQDSAEWAILNNKYKNTKKAYEDSLKLHNWTQLYKEADFNRPAFETLTNDEALDYIATTGDRNRADIEKIGFLGTPFLNPKRGTNPNDYNNYYGGVGHTWGTKDIPSKYFEDITEENKKIIELFKKQKIKPSHFINTDNPSGNDTGSLYPIYDKPKGQSPIAPTPPIKPIGTNVKYDSTYENLRMRPLWATMAKQDTTSKIGTLKSLDPLYEKGFTYGEAQKFPEEIRKQYKLDYPIYQNGGEITREDYLKQQHQDYLKSQAEKGRKAVVEGREKFAKDYVIPATKTVGGTAAVANKNNFVEKRQKGGIINKWMYKNMNPTMDIPSNIPGFVSVFNMKEVEPVARAGWAKRLGQPYNKKLLPTNPDGSVRLPDSVAKQIEVDTVAIKNKYKLYEDIAKSIEPEYSENSKLNAEKNLSLIDSYLNKLREAYKGNEVTVNEYEARKGAFDNQGYLNQETTPLNVLGNFAIKYNPITKRMEYRDTYDFIRGKGNKINFFERVIPGKPFEIRGVVPK